MTNEFIEKFVFLPVPLTNTDSGSIFPSTSSYSGTTTNNHIFKYMIGDVFADPEFIGDTVEVTGFNYLNGTYQGIIRMKFGNKFKEQHTNLIFESRLDKMDYVGGKMKLTEKPKDKTVRYRIFYFDSKLDNKSKQTVVELSNIRALAKYLNSIVKINPTRRIVMVSVVDENDTYVDTVKLLPKEIREQKFLTGLKERLLAHAKYELGYEVATNF